MRLKLAIDHRAGDGPAAAAALLKLAAIERKTRDISREPHALVQIVDKLPEAQWVIQYRVAEGDRQATGGRIVLLSADAANRTGPLDDDVPWFELSDATPAEELKDIIRRIVMVKNLLKLTLEQKGISYTDKPRPSNELSEDAAAIDVEVQMLRLKNGHAADGEPVSFQNGSPDFSPGNWVGWRVVNHSLFAVDVTLLYVDSKYNIQAAYPSRRGGAVENRFAPGGKLLAARARVSAIRRAWSTWW